MGKITKAMQPKHRETLSPWLKLYVDSASTAPLPLLPQQLADFPTRWPFGRGDLYHWIPLLNRFDSVLEYFCKVYKLNEGPQRRDFGCDVLLNHAKDSAFEGEKQWEMDDLTQLGFPSDGDRELIEAVLKFTRMLLEHCGNRSIYASSAHLNDLLNCIPPSILIATLEVGSELAQRYQASVKRIGSASRHISAALLANHYNIDLERVQQVALPFVKTPIFNLSDPSPTSAPASTSKGKDKVVAGGGSRNVATMHANDLVAITTADDNRWSSWGDVKVFYYPQETTSVQHDVPTEAGRSNLPSTPTPLRRSSTMNPQHTPKARNATAGEDPSPLGTRTSGFVDEHSSSGQKTFELPQSVVASHSIYELITRCPDDMPQAAKYEAFHRLRVAKALISSQESRQQILATRLLAITNLAYIHSESNFVEKVLRQDIDETRRFQLVYQLAELIHPSADGAIDVPLRLQTIALALLEAVSSFHARCQDVLSALNANVNHGILLYVIRKAVAGMTETIGGDDSDKMNEMDEWRNNLFSLTLHLSMATRVGSEMVSAGLMDILVEILNIRSIIAQRHHSMVLAFLDGLIWTYPNAFTAFFNADGLDAVAKLIVDTIGEARSLLQASKGIKPDQQSSAVDYEIPYYQQQTLKWILKFVHHIMSNSYSYSGNTDRLLRNLAEKSDLLANLRDIINDKKSFGSVVWTNSVTILSDFINNDPTSFAAISESGMIKTYLEAITGQPIPESHTARLARRPSDGGDPNTVEVSAITSITDFDERPHPPEEDTVRKSFGRPVATGILASSDAINVVPQVLNSISLNNAGMHLVVASRAIESFLEVFESPAHVKCMETDTELASNVGASFDELARHHPPLRKAIANAVIDMVARVRMLGIEKARLAGWGVKLLPIGTLQTAAESIAAAGASKSLQESDVDMSDMAVSQGLEVDKRTETERESPYDSYTPYIYALSTFLTTYLSNNVLKNSFVERGGIEFLLDMCQSPSLTAGYGDSMASRVLNQVVSQLVEHGAAQGLTSLLYRAQRAIDVLEPLSTKTEAVPPYFAPFLAPDLGIQYTSTEAAEIIATGTNIVKALLNAQTFIKIISDCFASSRSNSLQFYPINVYDYYQKLVISIGPLLRGVLAEEAGELTAVPQHWSLRRQSPPVEGGNRGAGADAEADDTSLPDVLGGTDSWRPNDGADNSSAARPTEQEQASPRFQNYETLRILLHPMIPTSFPLFQTIGKALLPRRESNHGDPYHRPRHLEIARALADTVLDHLGPSVATPEPTSKDFHYWIIMLHTIHEMLIDHPSTRQNDRSNVQIIMPVLLAFKERRGIEVLNSMLRVFAKTVKSSSAATADESSKVKVAAFGLKKILDLYFILVNGKYIADTHSFFNLQRQTDRSQVVPNIHSQITVEFRALILPVVMELWDSEFVERVPDQTVKRLVDILKMVSLAENELLQMPKDKVPFMLLNYTDVRFNWRSVRVLVRQLADDYDDGLAQEAVYRTLGNVVTAPAYCTAHEAEFAGARNPVPPEDEPDAASLAEGATPTTTSRDASGSRVPDPEAMSLDTSPDTSAETLDDLISRLPENNELATESGADTAPKAAEPAPPSGEANPAATTQYTAADFNSLKEDLDSHRAKLRENLIDQCLDVIRAHPDTAIEVSELITTVVLRHQNADAHEEVGFTLTSALASLGLEEDEKKRNGKCIAAYAHLLALLLQDEMFFSRNIETLRDKIDDYVAFLKVPPSTPAEELPPWIPFILLVLETLLSHDEKPVAAQWKAPKSLDETVSEPIIQLRTPLLDDQQRSNVLESLLDLLPRIGKEEMLATAILRVLVILTRRRSLAKQVGEKKNLQRLFLMAKQMSGAGSERLRQTRLTAHLITILRHIVEDEDVIKQIMRAEIKSDLPNLQRTQRGHLDVSTYLRAMAPVALRAPDLFVEVTNELLRFSRWNAPTTEGARPQALVWKEQDEANANVAQADTEETQKDDVKQSTESGDKEMPDAHKSHHDSKRPVVENPDGVIHFLLCELVNYREVEDKEIPTVSKDVKVESELTAPTEVQDVSSVDGGAIDGKDKKPPKPTFKSEEHPIFVYRCFLLSCLAELLQSYTRTKVEFINFKRSAPPLTTNTPVKPRSSILNYLIYDLLCQSNLSGTSDNIASKKKAATSSQTQKVLVALVSKTNEKVFERKQEKYAYDDEPDLLFVRKFVLDTILKAYEKAPLTDEPLEVRYARMQCLAELMNHMIGEKDKEQNSGSRNVDTIQTRSQAQLRRLMYEKGYLDKLTSSIAEINLNFPGVKRAIKYILRVLRVLTDTAKELSHSNILVSDSQADQSDEDFASTSSLSDLDEGREETPDLYRNSALGMLEPRGEDDESESEEPDDDDEDMYGDEYDDDEMDYGDEGMSDDEDNISDEDEELGEMGEIEGLHGEPGVVEVIMDDDDDDDDDDEDGSEDDDDDEVDSADMEDVEDRVEIVDEDGNPIEDDGESGWESETSAEEDEEPEVDDIDYEAEGQDEHEAHLHGLGPGDLLDNMARAIMGGDQDYEPEIMEALDEHYMDDGHEEGDDDEEEDIEDEEYIYDDDYPLNETLPPMPALGWDGFTPEVDDRHRQLFLLDNNRRPVFARMGDRNPFPPRFMAGSNRELSDFRSYFSRSHRNNGQQSNADDGINPLLRRSDQAQENQPRPGHSNSIGLRFPEGFLGPGRHMIDGPMGFLGELMEFLPIMGRNGNHSQQAFHVHITGPGGTRSADLGPIRGLRNDQRRDAAAQEPHQAVAFTPESTLDRYQEEARMIFGGNPAVEAARLGNAIIAQLTPAAMELERKLKAEEEENLKRQEEARKKREEEERVAREAKEAEERAERERKEAEEREAAARLAAEAAEAAALAASQNAEPQPSEGNRNQGSGAMEGVESTESGDTAANDGANTTARANRPRVTTIIRGEEVDVTELGIDPDYLAALPEEFREEVIAQTVSERRSQAREEAASGETTEVFQEFLDALPEELRLEIAQQERQEQRRRHREDSRRQAAADGQDAIPTEMDPASILLTFPPELREQALIDQGEDIMGQLPPEMAAQVRALTQNRPPVVHQQRGMRPIVLPGRTSLSAARAALQGRGSPDEQGENKSQRRAVVQMLDKAGVATLVRLMFIAQQGSIRNYLFSVFADVCENRQTRLEVISTILQILQDGSTDMNAVERSFGQLSLKARKQRDKDKDADQKAPQGLKRTLTTIGSLTTSGQTNSETSPLLIVQQCLDLLVDLCTKNPHIPWLFLTEHESVGSSLKRSLSRRGKGKDSKAHKYAINSLLTLLDRELVTESSLVMTHLADLLNRVTLPLQNLERRRKETQDEDASAPKSNEAETKAVVTDTNEAEQQTSNDQTAEGEAASEPAGSSEQQKAVAEDSKEQSKNTSQKRARQLQPPVIPPQNLTLVVRVFVARECSSKTFQNTISTIKNLSAIPGAKTIFGQELVSQARLLSSNIVSDLDDLLPHIDAATSGTEIQGVALAKFSPGASEQNKLLRVLTALDHLFDGKKKSDDVEEGGPSETEKQDLVTSLYHNSTFSTMWEKLSACLSAIRQRENMLNVATILLPLIESLMVVCKNTTTNDDLSHSQIAKDMLLSSPQPESRTANLFFTFTEDHRRILNELVRHNPKLMSGTFALLVKNPKVLEFDNKRNYFNRSVHSRSGQNQSRPSYPPLQISVRREHVFHDSFKWLCFKSGDEMKYGKLNIRFNGEEGVDAGGVTREWFQVLARQMFDPNYALFIPVSSDRTTFHPNKLSGINDEHLRFFSFIGRIIGKALYEGRLLDCFFSRAVYKRILGKSVSVKDMESFDPDYYKSLCWMLENDITDIITETFSVEDDEFGVTKIVDLVPNGREIAVTEENKHEYVRVVVEHKLLSSVKDQMENFLSGFHDIIPAELISIFNEQELELLISGLPDIDIDDWKANTEYHNYSPSSPQIQWFWRAVRSFDKEELAKLLQFVTGTSKVPLNGFKELEGMNGVNRFNIHRDYGNKDRLPSTHTCFNQLDLPEYDSYDILRSQIIKAITQGSDYFGFA